MQTRTLLPERCEEFGALQFPHTNKITPARSDETKESRRLAFPREEESRTGSHLFRASESLAYRYWGINE
jgi:hypothetical protein